MKIYTYYEDIFEHQKVMLDLWEKSWSEHGFEPIILNESDAKKSELYEKFKNMAPEYSKKFMGSTTNQYGLSCWFRWLAYSTQKEEKFYVSDYDVINLNFIPIDPDDVLHFMNGANPCLASGKPSQFHNFFKQIFEITEKHIEEFTKLFKELDLKVFHDQDFLILYSIVENFGRLNVGIKNNCKMTPINKNFISDPSIENFELSPLVHFSHNGCGKLCRKYKVRSSKEIRTKIIECAVQIIKNKQNMNGLYLLKEVAKSLLANQNVIKK
jgi:hypothetical protein